MISKNRLFQITFISIFIIAMLLQPAEASSAEASVAQPRQTTQAYSCIRPVSYEVKVLCANLEANILAVTVRIEMHTQYNLQGNVYTRTHPSHATIMSGRYLVTHNHFKFALKKTAVNGGEGYFAISLRRMDGSLILDQSPLSAFTVAYADPQTLVLEFLDARGNGLFAAQSLPSANFINWQSANLQPGTELSQIDWDGQTAHIDWVQVDNLDLADAVPQLQVNNFTRFGCSGGGVYWNGQHIGNNWGRNIEEKPGTDEITRRYSIVALNSSGVLKLAQ